MELAASKKVKVKQTEQKIMCTVFWENKRVFSVDFLPRGDKINTTTYLEALRKLHCTIQNKKHVE